MRVSLLHPLFQPSSVKGVLFDFHSTLVDQGSSESWLEIACESVGLDPIEFAQMVPKLNSIVEFARIEDPHHERDLSPAAHKEIFTRLLLSSATSRWLRPSYSSITDPWFVYADTLPVLDALRTQGITTAIISNIALDLEPILRRLGISECVDYAFTSAELGYVKPNPEIFFAVCEAIDIAPEHLLMVGDNAIDDGGAGTVGMRTLILPRTSGPIHGLATVLGVVAGSKTLDA